MVWVKLDDRFAINPKVVTLSHVAFRLHVEAMCYCGMAESGGFVSDEWIASLEESRRDSVEQLVSKKLWEKASKGYRIHDWNHFNPSKRQIREKRLAEREKKRKQRDKDRESPGDRRRDPTRARVSEPEPGLPSKEGESGGLRPPDPTGSGARPLGMNEDHARRLRDCGCTDGEIHLYVAPLSPEQAEAVVAELEHATANGGPGTSMSAWLFRRAEQARRQA